MRGAPEHGVEGRREPSKGSPKGSPAPQRRRRPASLIGQPGVIVQLFEWGQLDLNQRLPPCEGGTLPLSYAPEPSVTCRLS